MERCVAESATHADAIRPHRYGISASLRIIFVLPALPPGSCCVVEIRIREQAQTDDAARQSVDLGRRDARIIAFPIRIPGRASWKRAVIICAITLGISGAATIQMEGFFYVALTPRTHFR